MSDPEQTNTDQATEAADRTPPPAAPESIDRDHPIVRLTRWQTVLSVVSIFIALIALYAALSESAAVRQQTAASVWPLLQLWIEDSDDGEHASFAMRLTNAGVGPARVRAFKLRIEGRIATSWEAAAAALDGKLSSMESRNFVRNRVIRADETVTVFSTSDAQLARRLMAAVRHSQSAVTYCYCSIFDDCWLVADSSQQTDLPATVQACPDFGDDAFIN